MTGSWATAIGLRKTPTHITLRALIFTSLTTVYPTRYQIICTPRRLHTPVRSEVTKPTFSSIARGGSPNLGTVCLGFRQQKKPSRPVHNESPRWHRVGLSATFPVPKFLHNLFPRGAKTDHKTTRSALILDQFGTTIIIT